MLLKPFASVVIMTIFSCNGIQSQQNSDHRKDNLSATTEAFNTIGEIPTPASYYRKQMGNGSFTNWLRGLNLKKDRTVYLYNGQPKRNQSAQFAVIDISVGDRDLQQCADAAMRLRAEYLFDKKSFDEIRFNDNEGTLYQFKAPYTRQQFDPFLARVFGMCGTASLSKQMKPIHAQQVKPGDLLLKGGFPGHAVIIMDMAENDKGEIIYLLAQSYMPAQDIHVLVNPTDEGLSPWYKIDGTEIIRTPEWTFNRRQFKTW